MRAVGSYALTQVMALPEASGDLPRLGYYLSQLLTQSLVHTPRVTAEDTCEYGETSSTLWVWHTPS